MTTANPSTPEVTRALKPCPFCHGPAVNVAGEYVTCGSPLFIECAGRSIKADVAAWNTRTQARGGDELREALRASLAKRSQPAMDPPYTAAFNAALDMVARDVAPFLASTDMAGASVPDRLARRMGAEFIARDDVPQVEGLTSGEGLRALSDRATAGPWAWEQCGDKEDAPVVGIAFPGDDPDCKAQYEGEFRDSDASRMTIAYDWQWCDGNSPSANAAFAVACVNYVRAMLAASPKAAATASVREDCAAACDRIATGSVYIGESEEGRARHEGIIAGARNCAAAIRRLTDSGTAATIGGERA